MESTEDSSASFEVVTKQQTNLWDEDTPKEEMNGGGILTLNSGDKYEGEFKEGNKRGIGKFTWKNGDTFEGNHYYQIRIENKVGKMLHQLRTGCVTGYNHDSHGYGKYTFANNGEVFEGEYRYGRQNGRGIYRYKNGDLFIGKYIQL